MKKLVTKWDFVIISVCLLASLLFFALKPRETGEEAIIRVDGKEYKTVNINSTDIDEITVNGVTVVYGGGEIYIKDSSCRDRICVNAGHLSKKGQSAVCAPNRVSVEIKSDGKNAPRAVTG